MFFTKNLILVSAILALVAPVAHAATLTYTGSPSSVGVVTGYNPTPDVPISTPLTVYSASAGATLSGGLFLDLSAGEIATVTYTVVGQESGFFNYLVVEGLNIPETNIGVATHVSVATSQLLDFGFASNRLYGTSASETLWSIINGGVSEVASFKLGFGSINDSTANYFSLFAYFGDGTGDSDFDDIIARIDIDVSQVPLPAGLLLLGSGLFGLGALRRRKR